MRKFDMKILQWLHLTGEVDKSVRFSCKIISRFNIPKNRFIFDSSELKRWPFSATQCTVAAAVKCIVFIHSIVQRDCATSRGAEGPRDVTACSGKSRKLKSFCDGDVDRSTTGRFGPASGRTGRALPTHRRTRRRRTDSEHAECYETPYVT